MSYLTLSIHTKDIDFRHLYTTVRPGPRARSYCYVGNAASRTEQTPRSTASTFYARNASSFFNITYWKLTPDVSMM